MLWIATRSAFAHPFRLWTSRASCVDRVGPVSGPAIALHTHHDRLPIGHRLIHVKFQICEYARRTCKVHPHVVEEILGVGVIGEGYGIAFIAIVFKRSDKFLELPYFEGELTICIVPRRRSRAASVMSCSPPAQRFDRAHESAYEGIDTTEVLELLTDDFTLIVTSLTHAAPFDPHAFTCSTCEPVEEEMLLLID